MKAFEFGGVDELAQGREEGEFLYGLVRAIKPKICLEIGTHKGYSTQHILQAIMDNGEGHLWTTDPVDYGAFGLIKFEERHWVDFLHLRGEDVKLDQKIDFVYIDGHHELADVYPEIMNLLPQLSKNAVMVFHDAQDEPENIRNGVNAAIKKAKLQTTWLPTKYCLQVYQHNKVV